MGDPKRAKLSTIASLSAREERPDNGDMRVIAGELFDIARRLNGAALVPDTAGLPHDTDDSSRFFPHRGSNAKQKDTPRQQQGKRTHHAALAREIYAIRRQRATIFGDVDLFGEPAWDILLDLYVACAEDKKVSVSSACIGSASPPTTGLRWLGVLADKGLILREHDPADQRRVLVRLSDKGLEAMDAFFEGTVGRF